MSRQPPLGKTCGLLAVIVLIAATACAKAGGITMLSSAAGAAPTTSTTLDHPSGEVTVQSDPRPDAVDVPVGSLASVTVTGGTLDDVSFSAAGGPLDGVTSDDRSSWTSTAPPLAASTYQVVVKIAEPSGSQIKRSWQFTTASAAKTFKATISPNSNATVGVGMPIVMKLTAPVGDAQRAGFESRLTVTATPPVTGGGWHWFSPTEVHWRPHDFWVPGTTVNVDAKLAGMVAGNGAAGVADVTATFLIGESHVSVVDASKHVMVVTVNGAAVRLIPVSTGRDKYPTHSGTHVVSEKMEKHEMTSAAIGIPPDAPGGYRETVYWDVRISNSGEFVHAAPWSTGSQGRRNVSHGCVNISTANAKWFFAMSRPGDVVTVIGTPLRLQPTNGFGDWEIPESTWSN